MKTKSYPLDWGVEDYDGHNNSMWAALGGSTDGDSADLHYRIRQEVQDDKHYFVENSSLELMQDDECPRRWRSKQAAMNAMQRDHNEMMRSYEEARA